MNATPAVVGRGQSGLHGNSTGAHGRQHIHDIGFHRLLDIKANAAVFSVYRSHLVVRPVLDDVLVVVIPEFFEQTGFGRDIRVGVEYQYLGFRLGLLEVMSHLAGALIRSGRATVRRFRYCQGVNAAIGHGFELFAQRQGFRAGFPGLQNLTVGIRVPQAFDGVKHHVNAGRQHQFVIAYGGAVQ